MATYNYKVGLGNVGSYQVAGVPWVSGNVSAGATTAQSVSFPTVTSWVMVVNNATGNCRVGFSKNGVDNNNYFTLRSLTNGGPNTLGPIDLKVTQLWVSGSTDVDIIAGLTCIEPLNINNIAISPSGSNWSGSLGALVG